MLKSIISEGAAMRASMRSGMRRVVNMKLFFPARSINSRFMIIPTLLTIVGVCLLITAALLYFAYAFRTRPDSAALAEGHKERGHDITWRDAFIIGCAQAVAVLPGLSRSGTTIATGLMLGDRRDKVAQFSFFMVIIPILGEALLDIKDMAAGSSVTAETIGWAPLAIGFMASFVVGCAACRWMISLVKRGKLV